MPTRAWRSGKPVQHAVGDRGAPDLPAGPVASDAAAKYFVTGPNVRVERTIGGAIADLAGGPFHAKTMGTSTTACGASASSWVKVWDVPFARTPQPACRTCVDAVAALT